MWYKPVCGSFKITKFYIIIKIEIIQRTNYTSNDDFYWCLFRYVHVFKRILNIQQNRYHVNYMLKKGCNVMLVALFFFVHRHRQWYRKHKLIKSEWIAIHYCIMADRVGLVLFDCSLWIYLTVHSPNCWDYTIRLQCAHTIIVNNK